MLPKSTAMRQAGQSILGDVRGDVGKMGDKGGEKEPHPNPLQRRGLKKVYIKGIKKKILEKNPPLERAG